MKIGVCICTYKRPELLERLLISLQKIQTGGLGRGDVHLIVVDNDPDGRARAVCERVSGQLPLELDFVEEQQPGRSFARNRAVAEILDRNADFIAFIDDDDLPEPDWLDQLLAKQKETQADIVCGAMRAVAPTEWPEWLKSSPLFDKPKEKSSTKFGTPKGIGTFNVLISRRVLERLKPLGPIFAHEFAFSGIEDTEFFVRAQRNGATFALSEKSIIHRNFEDSRQTFSGLLRYALRLGRYSMRLLKKHGTSLQIRKRMKKVIKNIAIGMLKIPFCMTSKVRSVRNLYKLSKEFGMLYAYVTSKL